MMKNRGPIYFIRDWKTNMNELGSRVSVALDDSMHSSDQFSRYPNSQFRYAVGVARTIDGSWRSADNRPFD